MAGVRELGSFKVMRICGWQSKGEIIKQENKKMDRWAGSSSCRFSVSLNSQKPAHGLSGRDT